MQRVADLKLDATDKDLAVATINLAMAEMTADSKVLSDQSFVFLLTWQTRLLSTFHCYLFVSTVLTSQQEVIPDYQGAASALLVTMGMKYTTEVINKLLELFGPGVVPHFFIIKVAYPFISLS